MLINFFHGLKDAGVPVSTTELLTLLEGLKQRVAFADMDDFYYFSRTCMVKDEKYFDRFDRAFGLHFQDLEALDDIIEALIPDDWLRSEFMKNLSEEDKAKIESLGGLEKLIEEFKKRLEEQKKRHEGGNKWIGTGGTSPFGQEGYHPEGIRVGPNGKNKKAAQGNLDIAGADLDLVVEVLVIALLPDLHRLLVLAVGADPDAFRVVAFLAEG